MQNEQKSQIADFTLNFGKFKGELFSQTPDWYQNWLPQQAWFKIPTNSQKTISHWGVFYMPTKQGRIFANLKAELMAEFDSQDDALRAEQGFNMGGHIDELHYGYRTLPIYK